MCLYPTEFKDTVLGLQGLHRPDTIFSKLSAGKLSYQVLVGRVTE